MTGVCDGKVTASFRINRTFADAVLSGAILKFPGYFHNLLLEIFIFDSTDFACAMYARVLRW